MPTRKGFFKCNIHTYVHDINYEINRINQQKSGIEFRNKLNNDDFALHPAILVIVLLDNS